MNFFFLRQEKGFLWEKGGLVDKRTVAASWPGYKEEPTSIRSEVKSHP